LHKYVFRSKCDSASALTAEALESWIRLEHPDCDVKATDFDGVVDFAPWRRNQLIYDSALIVLSREWADESEPSDDDRVMLRRFLNEHISYESRVNRVLTISKKRKPK